MPQRGRNDGQIVKIGGILSGVTRKVTKKGDAWAAATLEDLGGAIEVLFFPNSYQLYATAIADDAIVIVKGKVDRRDDVPKLIAMDMTIPDLTTGADGTAPFVLQLPVTKCVPPVVEQLRDVLRTHPGTTEVHLRLRGNQKTTVVRLDDKLRVTAVPGPARRPQATPRPFLHSQLTARARASSKLRSNPDQKPDQTQIKSRIKSPSGRWGAVVLPRASRPRPRRPLWRGRTRGGAPLAPRFHVHKWSPKVKTHQVGLTTRRIVTPVTLR